MLLPQSLLPLWRRTRASLFSRQDLIFQRDVALDRVIELEALVTDLRGIILKTVGTTVDHA